MIPRQNIPEKANAAGAAGAEFSQSQSQLGLAVPELSADVAACCSPPSPAPATAGCGACSRWSCDQRAAIWQSANFKLNLSTKEATRAVGSPRIFQRLRFHGWLKPLSKSRDALYPWSRLLAAQAKMEAGEMPPLLPSEEKERVKRLAERKSAA